MVFVENQFVYSTTFQLKTELQGYNTIEKENFIYLYNISSGNIYMSQPNCRTQM